MRSLNSYTAALSEMSYLLINRTISNAKSSRREPRLKFERNSHIEETHQHAIDEITPLLLR